MLNKRNRAKIRANLLKILLYAPIITISGTISSQLKAMRGKRNNLEIELKRGRLTIHKQQGETRTIKAISSINIKKDSKFFLVHYYDGKLALVCTQTLKSLKTFENVLSADFSFNYDFLFLIKTDDTDNKTGELIQIECDKLTDKANFKTVKIFNNILSFGFSHYNNFIFIAYDDENFTAELINAKNGNRVGNVFYNVIDWEFGHKNTGRQRSIFLSVVRYGDAEERYIDKYYEVNDVTHGNLNGANSAISSDGGDGPVFEFKENIKNELFEEEETDVEKNYHDCFNELSRKSGTALNQLVNQLNKQVQENAQRHNSSNSYYSQNSRQSRNDNSVCECCCSAINSCNIL